MTRIVNPGIGTQIITATQQPKKGDREDFVVRVQGPEPRTDFKVPLSITGTALAIWDTPNPAECAETLGAAVFRVIGTASIPPSDGFWFDSFNSGDTLRDTVNIIHNQGAKSFIKNYSNAMYVIELGNDLNIKIQQIDEFFSQKFGYSFFKSIEDISEESQRIGDLNAPAADNAGFLYRICLLSGIIDHINVRLNEEDDHICNICNKRHKPSEGSLQGFKKWLASKLGSQKAIELTTTFSMVKKIRQQYPIHDQYVITPSNTRAIKKEIESANSYFGIVHRDHGHNAAVVINRFGEALTQIQVSLM